jgi:hypothetical protein
MRDLDGAPCSGERKIGGFGQEPRHGRGRNHRPSTNRRRLIRLHSSSNSAASEGTMKTLLFDFVFALVIIGAFATAFTIFLSP